MGTQGMNLEIDKAGFFIHTFKSDMSLNHMLAQGSHTFAMFYARTLCVNIRHAHADDLYSNCSKQVYDCIVWPYYAHSYTLSLIFRLLRI